MKAAVHTRELLPAKARGSVVTVVAAESEIECKSCC